MRLKIRQVSRDDFGMYQCVAKNSLGETDGTIKLYGNSIQRYLLKFIPYFISFFFILFDLIFRNFELVTIVGYESRLKLCLKVNVNESSMFECKKDII